ncbi:MAG: hypothetical protein K0S36_2301 [Nitrosospira multiformis]|nr:hypothetical protein [Nitrosospira multiformis]
MIRFLSDTTLSGYLYGKGTAVSFDKSIEDSLITLKSAEAYDPDGFHPYYHFHGFIRQAAQPIPYCAFPI